VRVTEYNDFVRKTKQFGGKPKVEQQAIALYGLVGEIGSLVAAVKKQILAEGGETTWDQPNDEIKEELGDALWYCYASAQIVNQRPFDILASDIEILRQEIGSANERAQKIATTLDPLTRDAFLEAAKLFPRPEGYCFDDYQRLAFKTARTDGRVLLEVCLAVLWQLGAELLRPTLPQIEITLNKNVADRPTNIILGEITWHLSAMASLYHLSLDEVVAFNCQKVSFRSERSQPTPLHDADRDPKEQFPRVFHVSFVRIGANRSRMYFDGRPLGDDLTDNFYQDDGYRFHDVIHLALIAHLGWSPVVRGLMKRKRKSKNDRVDEVEDGGRAQVVEELVVKAIHSEGDRQAKAAGRCRVGKPTRLFPGRNLINFRLLKTLRTYVEGLEVWNNTFWEWENAIYEGCEMFFELSNETQGMVRVDLEKRRLTFTPTVSPGLQGITVGLGMGTTNSAVSSEEAKNILFAAELEWAESRGRIADTVAAKRAILEALGLGNDRPSSGRSFRCVSTPKTGFTSKPQMRSRIASGPCMRSTTRLPSRVRRVRLSAPQPLPRTFATSQNEFSAICVLMFHLGGYHGGGNASAGRNFCLIRVRPATPAYSGNATRAYFEISQNTF
jgi:NTP pyrophosphatase (non-canonical NTP hydrolase)